MRLSNCVCTNSASAKPTSIWCLWQELSLDPGCSNTKLWGHHLGLSENLIDIFRHFIEQAIDSFINLENNQQIKQWYKVNISSSPFLFINVIGSSVHSSNHQLLTINRSAIEGSCTWECLNKDGKWCHLSAVYASLLPKRHLSFNVLIDCSDLLAANARVYNFLMYFFILLLLCRRVGLHLGQLTLSQLSFFLVISFHCFVVHMCLNADFSLLPFHTAFY